MSINYFRKAWLAPMKGSVKLVYLALADSADEDGVCFPSYEYLAYKCGISKSTVIRAVNNLVRRKFLTVENRDNTSNLFTLAEISDEWLEKFKWKNRKRKPSI